MLSNWLKFVFLLDISNWLKDNIFWLSEMLNAFELIYIFKLFHRPIKQQIVKRSMLVPLNYNSSKFKLQTYFFNSVESFVDQI